MGGSAFAVPKPGEPPLKIRRLPINIYESLCQSYSDRLSTLYERVAIPRSAPEKTSHGDLDIIVCSAKYQFSVEDLAAKLGALRYIHCARNPTTNFAIPLGDSLQSGIDSSSEIEADTQCFQLDVEVCTPETFDWEVFHKAYGDLWNILGTSIRPVGLTVNHTGLHLRIPQIEAKDRKGSLLFLTNAPADILAFLGLSQETYEARFKSVEDLFRFAISGRFFRRGSYLKEGLKSNDRQRLKQREIFRRFVEKYLPAHPEIGQEDGDGKSRIGSKEVITRDAVLQEALDTFNRRPQYNTIIAEWEKKQREAEMWRKVAAAIPLDGEKLNLVIRGLKRWATLDNDGQLCLREGAILDGTGGLPVLTTTEGGEARLLNWVKRNWEEVREREKRRVGEAKQQRKTLSKA
ncbi:MAG: hypothetical protein M1835_008202 [Candelina submexicana]|nr:MAG: hypothetical protein M1835_008202 [Candelina submexicana]